MERGKQRTGLLALFVMIISTSIGCAQANPDIKAQSQSHPQSMGGVARADEPAWPGKAEGKLLPFNPTVEDRKAAVLSHPLPEVWLSFPATEGQTRRQSDAANGEESPVRVELPPEARPLLMSHWQVALAARYNMDIAGTPDGETYRSQLVAMINSFQSVSGKLTQLQIDAPNGRRPLSQGEANDLAAFIGASATEIIKQAKQQGK